MPVVLFGLVLSITLSPFASQAALVQEDRKDPIVIDAPELAHINFDLTTGGLPIQPGLETFTVFRSNKEHPELADGRGWTYQHHPDIAAWHGRLYVGRESGERDEDVWPSRELISSSADGKDWSKPADMFQQGVGTALRMYFFHAPNGRMLVIAGLRENTEKLNERKKGGLIVRELRADGTMGDVFTHIPHRFTVEERPRTPGSAAGRQGKRRYVTPNEIRSLPRAIEICRRDQAPRPQLSTLLR